MQVYIEYGEILCQRMPGDQLYQLFNKFKGFTLHIQKTKKKQLKKF